MRIKKVNQTVATVGQIVNEASDSTVDTYSCDYINNLAENGLIEEGEWTPTMQNANVTYTIRKGFYRKIGDLVFITFKLRGTINSVSSPAYAFIEGLPYSTNGYDQTGCLMEASNCFSDTDNQYRMVQIINSMIGIRSGASGGTDISLWAAKSGTFYLTGSATYICSDQ